MKYPIALGQVTSEFRGALEVSFYEGRRKPRQNTSEGSSDFSKRFLIGSFKFWSSLFFMRFKQQKHLRVSIWKEKFIGIDSSTLTYYLITVEMVQLYRFLSDFPIFFTKEKALCISTFSYWAQHCLYFTHIVEKIIAIERFLMKYRKESFQVFYQQV